jgi:hypothetical protein
MIGLGLAAVLVQPYTPAVPALPDYSHTTDARFCELVRARAARLPRPLASDPDTILSSLDISCPDRTVAFVYYSELPPWRAGETLRTENRLMCVDGWSPYRSMIQRGWRMTAKWTSRSGESVSPPLTC